MSSQEPLLCLVTDRQRLPGQTDAERMDALDRLVAVAVDAGLDLVQIRERDLDAAVLARVVERAVRRSRGTATAVVVNDRVDVALAAGADGVHLRGDSIPPAAARALAPPGWLIGCSVHSADDTRSVAPACDYLIAGTMFATSSKPGVRLLGSTGLRTIVAAAGRTPVLAIGGVTVGRASEVARSGARGVAAIGLFTNLSDTAVERLKKIVSEVRKAFDTAVSRS